MHARVDKRYPKLVAIIEGVRRAGKKLVVRRGWAAQAIVTLGQLLEKTPLVPPRHVIGNDDAGQGVIVIAGIQLYAQTDLFQVVQADRSLRPGFGPGQNRQHQGGENGDDGNHHEKLNQRERPTLRFHRSYDIAMRGLFQVIWRRAASRAWQRLLRNRGPRIATHLRQPKATPRFRGQIQISFFVLEISQQVFLVGCLVQ